MLERDIEECHLRLIAAAVIMLSCLESRKSSVVRPAEEQLHGVDKNSFFQLLRLATTHTSSSNGHSSRNSAIECDVIVIDDDDDDEQVPHHHDSCKADLFGTTRPLRGDIEMNGNASSRLLQPNSRLRKLLGIDVSSNLGTRVLRAMSALSSDGLPLNPYTVSHSLSGSDNTLDYGTFCRTPVKGVNSGRLRHRDFPVKYRPASAGTYCHYYCLTRADRRRFCRRFDTGLSARSRRLRRKYRHCSIALERLTEEETTDWRCSRRLLDYVARMQEKDAKEREAAAPIASHNDDEVISLSSDSEDEDRPLAAKKHDLMFRCHQCDVKLPCGDGFRGLIREHYRIYHDIVNIDIVRIQQPDGSTAMQIIHIPPAAEQRAPVVNSGSPVDLCGSETSATQPPQHSISLRDEFPNSSEDRASPPVPDEAPSDVCMQPSDADGSMVAIGISGHPVPLNHSQTHTLTQLQNSIRPPARISGPVPVLPLPKNLVGISVLLNGSAHCRGSPPSVPSSCDADIICLD